MRTSEEVRGGSKRPPNSGGDPMLERTVPAARPWMTRAASLKAVKALGD
jgi:hypothetical protein